MIALASLSDSQLIAVAGGGAVALAAVGFGVRRYLRKRPTPEETERLRRLDVNGIGKIGNGEIVDVTGEAEEATIVYSYAVAGVGYTASQDVSALAQRLPPDRIAMVGPVAIKFDPRNPANSIVLCEEWTGLQRPRAR